jgi:hypothetical protein
MSDCFCKGSTLGRIFALQSLGFSTKVVVAPIKSMVMTFAVVLVAKFIFIVTFSPLTNFCSSMAFILVAFIGIFIFIICLT